MIKYAASTENLLKTRIRDLKLQVEGTPIAKGAAHLYRELDRRGMGYFRPRIYLGDEWFSPEGETAIAVPFYLAHPRLLKLEKLMMNEAEGEDPSYFMKLLRHEAGHCFDHAYGLSKTAAWRKLFGSPKRNYRPECYQADPTSTNFVYNLNSWYAQSHPDEDFAETFAVWLNPRSNWRTRYAQWPVALHKLEYIQCIASTMALRPMAKSTPPSKLLSSAQRMHSTLGRYYAKRKNERYDVTIREVELQSR